MPVSRRRFLKASGAVSAATATVTLAQTQGTLAADPALTAQQIADLAPAAAPELPQIAIIALNRMGYGPRPGDITAFNALGSTPSARLTAYVNQQLNPVDSQDTTCNTKLQNVKLRISYTKNTLPFTEDRALTSLNKTLAQLWALRDDPAYEERVRPVYEVRLATWLRAVYSKWQLREVMIEFWHNHFNVNAFADTKISVTLPLYDKLMRQHWGGNFRTLLEGVAQSPAMQFYLDNASNKTGGPNENYARELFELHTLGSENYFNALYDNWRDVPGATSGKPIGYIDEDVYEAARAFTGWTIADGSWNGSANFPNTGQFTLYANWHDRFQKRVLATELQHDQTPLQDGQKVLNLLAYHPGTARHLCTKLCQRLVADVPPQALIDRAVQAWAANQTKPDQIKQTLKVILLSPEFAEAWGQKVKRPFELFAAFLRATQVDFPPGGLFVDDNLSGTVERTGYRLFSWPTPIGHPDTATPWLSSNVMLLRWNILNDMLGRGFWRIPDASPAPFNLRGQIPASATTSRQIVDFWVSRLLGRTLASNLMSELYDFMSQGSGPDVPPIGDTADVTDRINYLVTLICMTPDFQWR
jgi:uncharacterized protein (DUF1800 family)